MWRSRPANCDTLRRLPACYTPRCGVEPIGLVAAVSIVAASLAHAWVDPDAADLLRCAAERHGGQTIATVVDRSSITYYGPGGVPAAILDVDSILDSELRRLRATFFVGDDVVLIQQLTGDTGFTYTPETGVVPLPPSERATFAQTFVTGIAGILLGEERDVATILPDVTLGDVAATAVELVSEGVEHLVFLDDACTLVAEVTVDNRLGELLSYYLDYREVDGFLVPFAAELYLGDELFASTETFETRIGAPIDESAFDEP